MDDWLIKVNADCFAMRMRDIFEHDRPAHAYKQKVANCFSFDDDQYFIAGGAAGLLASECLVW